MGNMTRLSNRLLKLLMWYATGVLACSIPVYYFIISRLWQHELEEHKIVLTEAAGKEDNYMIIGAVTSLTVLFFVLLLGGFILLNRKISKRIWQPFYQSLNAIKKFDLTQHEKLTFEDTDIEEFSELNQSLDKLIAGNVTVFNQQKEFADNASHELQTPLAIIQSKLDLLLQSKDLTNEQYNIIEEANKALARVTRINKNLLLLTKIENSEFMENERIDVSELLSSTISVLTNFSEQKQLDLTTTIAPGIIVTGNKVLIEILWNNLLINAIRYSHVGGTISVLLSSKKLVISNAGNGSLKHEHLFKRFSSISSQTPGTGLGLALAKQICNRYHWEISYNFQNSNHVFYVHF
jgi:signal transduction histidine kinase